LGPQAAAIRRVGECVSVADLDTLSEIYETLLDQLLSK